MGQSNRINDDKARVMGRIYQPVGASRGSRLACRGWPQEAALRMLMNSLDEEVGERPRELVACGATRKVLRDWDCYHATVKALETLESNETLLVQSGKPGAVHETNDDVPRVLLVNSRLEVRFQASDTAHEDEPSGLAMPSQVAAASWTYVGSQGELPTAFQTFDAVSRKHFGASLAGKLVVSGGMGAAGGASSLAAGLLGAAFLGVEIDEERIKRRIRTGYCDYCVNTLDEALRILKNAVRQRHAVSVGLVGNCADVIPELASRGVVPDILTDQTSAHDLLKGYVPSGLAAEEARAVRRENPQGYLERARESIVRHFEGMLALMKLGSVVFEFGNNIGAVARESGHIGNTSAFPDFVKAYLQPLLCEGMAPVRWVALSGEAGDIRRLDDLALELFPNDPMLNRWMPLARRHVRFQGLPARVCWLGPETRIALATHMNRRVAEGALKAPIVMALDPVGAGPKVSPVAGPAKLEERNDAATDRNVLDALLNAAAGATWAAIESEGGDWRRLSAALVADGTREAAKRLHRVLGKASGP